MMNKLDAALRFHQDALSLRAQRQEVLSTNIAHADTPNYKARDFDFGQALAQAVERGQGGAGAQGTSLLTTSARHIGGHAAASAAPGHSELLYRTPTQSSMDGNTVEMDAERVQFADNAARYEANLTVMSAKIKSLLAAAQ
jgi:flagellar basal-body rod protein FlgB